MPRRHLPGRTAARSRSRAACSPFIELGVGFNPELTARDNVVVNAALLGMPTAEALARFPEIIRFAELERFVDLKLKNYSSGMQVRLGFAAAIQADADIYLVDEVLAVGDARFQEKCFDVFRQIKRDGRTVIYVTHDLATVERFCDRALLLEGGEVADDRRPARRHPHLPPARPRAGAGRARAHGRRSSRWGDGAAEIVDAWFEDAGGERQDALAQGEEATFRAQHPVHRGDGGARLRRDRANETRRARVRDQHDVRRQSRPGVFAAGDEAVYRVAFALDLSRRPLHRLARRSPTRTRSASPTGARTSSAASAPSATPAASSTCRTRSRSSGWAHRPCRRRRRSPESRCADGRRDQPAEAGTGRRAPGPLPDADHGARGCRVQAALFRVGARISVDVPAAVDAVRRPLRRLHGDRQVRGPGPPLPRGAADGNRAVQLLRGGDQRRRLSSLVDRENLLRKVSFPRAAIPVAVTLTAAANLGLGLLVVVLLAFIDGVDVRATWLLVPTMVFAIIVFALSFSLLLSVLYVRFRDVRPIWEVVLQLFFWGSPIIYTIQSVPAGFRELVMCNPFAAALQQIRHWFVNVGEPSAYEAIGGGALILIPIAIFVLVLLVSYWTFVRTAPHVAEDL